jgi:hypothetical protein
MFAGARPFLRVEKMLGKDEGAESAIKTQASDLAGNRITCPHLYLD